MPWIAAAGELKTKPTQHTVQKLREIGIQPDVLLCRADRAVPDEEREKISLFTNVPPHGVISMWDVDTIYKVPRMLHEQGLDELICMKLQLLTKPADLKRWDRLVHEVEHPAQRGDASRCAASTPTCRTRTSRSTRRCATPASTTMRASTSSTSTPRTLDDRQRATSCRRFDAVLVPGGFGKRGVEGKILRRALSRASTSCPTSASAWACRSRPSSSRATWPGLDGANCTEFDPRRRTR